MNHLNKLYGFIESIVFTSSAYAANTLASFTVYAQSSKEYKEAVDNLKQNPGPSAEQLADRIELLLSSRNDVAYMHKYDSSIAVYSYLIFQLSPQVFREKVLKMNLPTNMWWAKQMISVLKDSLNTSATFVHDQNDIGTLNSNNSFEATINFKSNASNELEIVRL